MGQAKFEWRCNLAQEVLLFPVSASIMLHHRYRLHLIGSPCTRFLLVLCSSSSPHHPALVTSICLGRMEAHDFLNYTCATDRVVS